MIFPQQNDLGRRVIYRPPEAGHRYGIITAIYPRRVFVRFDDQHYSRAVNPAYLAFAKRPLNAQTQMTATKNRPAFRRTDRHGQTSDASGHRRDCPAAKSTPEN